MEILSVAELKIGMFVAEPDCPWAEFTFAFQGFVISTPEQVDIFQTKCRFVYIDRSRSLNEHYAPPKHEKDGPLKASLFQRGPVEEDLSGRLGTISLVAEKRQSRRRRFLDFLHSQKDNDDARELSRELSYIEPRYDQLSVALTETFRLFSEGQDVDIAALREGLRDISGSLQRNPDAVMWLLRLKQFDQYSFDHAMEVAVNMILLGSHIGWRDQRLLELGLVGLLQDIGHFVREEDLPRIPRNEQILIVTGSQGEVRAQLSRISRGEHPSIKLGPKDTVIFSSRPIPGNEKEIIAVKNNLAASGVRTISPRDTKHCIHISGHPARDEITRMLGWVKPACVIPVHGERTMLEAHAELARKCQISNTIVPNNGSVIRLAPGTPEILDHIKTGLLAVEPSRIIDAAHEAITQRRKLQYSGAVHLTLVLDKKGSLKSDPHITTVGLIDPETEDGQDFEGEILDEMDVTLESLSDSDITKDDIVSEKLRIAIRRFVEHALKIKPKVTIHVVRL